MDATTTNPTSQLPAPPPPPPLAEHRTDEPRGSEPRWMSVAATVVAQIAWLAFIFFAWVTAVVVITLGGGTFGTAPESVDAWMALASFGALVLAPMPTVAFIVYRRTA